MLHRFIFSTCLVFSITVYNCHGFTLTTATVNDVQLAIQQGLCTCRQIIEGYVKRINAYNRQGPMIGGVISTNPNALIEADNLDNCYRQTGRFVGILHCAPLLVKDNIDVAGLPTTAGVSALLQQRPLADADAVRNARQAGAIVIGKANLSPFADKEVWGNSETGGLIRNPYGLNYTTYGSSGGNGASGAAMFTILGFGTETGVSVNLPSSAANLVGLRPPVCLVSQQGVLPNSVPQDVVGPMAKTVMDVALLLDAEVGNVQTRYYSSADNLRIDGLRGARINILKLFTYDQVTVPNFGTYNVDSQIVDMINTMVTNMVNAGALVRNVTIDESVAMPIVIQMLTKAGYESCLACWRDAYFANTTRFNDQAPFRSFASFVQSPTLNKFYRDKFARDLNNSSPTRCNEQLQSYYNDRQTFINTFLTPLLADADVAFWPAMPVFPPKLAADAFNRDYGSANSPAINLINAGSWSAFPTIDVPIGFSQPLPDAPDGLPAGAIFISRPEKLNCLLRIAYAYQACYGVFKVPSSVPELTS